MQGDARCGTHAVPRVTSVNPGACKYNHRPELRGGVFSILTRTSERRTGTTSTRYVGSSLKVVKPVFVLKKPCTPCPEL